MRHPARASRVVPLVALAAAALTAACSGGDGDTADARWQTVTDTIGDTVVVRTVGASDSAALIRLVEEQRIGELDGAEEYQFANVGTILPAPGGGVYVWDYSTDELRRYDSAGVYVRRIGGKGGGPGEFDSPNGMGVLPDGRLVLWDARNTRMNLYDTAGAPAGSWPAATNFFTMRSVVVDTAGRLNLFTRLDEYDPANPGKEWRRGYVRVTADGSGARDTLVEPDLGPAPPTVTASSMSNGRVAGTVAAPVPYSPQAHRAMSPHGYYVTARGDRFAVTLHRPEGPLRIERDAAPVPVHEDERASEEASVTAMLRNNDPNWRWNGPAIPSVKPLIRMLQVDADGRIWVGRSMPGVRIPDEEVVVPTNPRAGPPRRWREPVAYDVFAPDGRFLGHLALPRRTSLHYMRGDQVWASVTDSMDVPYVTRFRVEWPAGR